MPEYIWQILGGLITIIVGVIIIVRPRYLAYWVGGVLIVTGVLQLIDVRF